jgi:hypothetical protein
MHLNSVAAGAYPGGMHRMHVHLPPPCASPPPQPERLVMRGGGVGQPKMCIPPGKILGTPLPVGYTDTVLFPTIGNAVNVQSPDMDKPDIYRRKD